jgi:hypothetical protein
MILLAVGLIKALMTNREKTRIPPRGPLAAGKVEAAGHTTFLLFPSVFIGRLLL